MPFALVIGAIVAVTIKREDGGPIFFRQQRVGKDGIPYTMWKFRSMVVGAPVILTGDGSTLTNADDPRITNMGRLLRSTSIDELPQIVNVLRGEMSWVGPRPSLVSALGTFLDDELAKLEVRPGITGYTQAFYRNSISNRDKRLLDAWYARNRSAWLDFRILIATISMVLSRKNQLSDG